MKIRLVKPDEAGRFTAFYRHVTEDTPHMAEYCRWIYGLHPADDIIEDYIGQGSLYCAEENGSVVAAAAMTPYQEEDYHPVAWGVDARDDEVSVIHILCVDPSRQGHGLAKEMMRELIAVARAQGKKAVRLDALEGNAPAHLLYNSLGFVRRGRETWYACNLGMADFVLYETIL